MEVVYNLSAYFEYGVYVEKLVGSGRGPTNLLPEIAWALLTDSRLGQAQSLAPPVSIEMT